MAVAKGSGFLIGNSLKKLEAMYKREKDSKAKIRLLCAIHRKKGETIQDVADSVGIPLMTVSDHLRRLESKGLEALYDEKRPGRPTWLTKKQEKKMTAMLEKSPEEFGYKFKLWTTKLVMHVLKEEFSVDYKLRNIQRLVYVWGFSIKKPRPKHRDANPREQALFKKNFQGQSNPIQTVDGRSYFLMRASLV